MDVNWWKFKENGPIWGSKISTHWLEIEILSGYNELFNLSKYVSKSYYQELHLIPSWEQGNKMVLIKHKTVKLERIYEDAGNFKKCYKLWNYAWC